MIPPKTKASQQAQSRVRALALRHEPTTQHQQDRLTRGALVTAIALAFAVGGMAITTHSVQAEQIVSQQPLSIPAGPPSFADVAERVIPAVVNVTVAQKPIQQMSMPMPQGIPEDSPMREFFQQFGQIPDMMPRQREGQGSGFIISSEGHIVTNNHVIDDADQIQVSLADGRTLPATVVGRDPKTDLAVIRIQSDQPLPFVELSDSAEARVGDWVLAIGNPFGLGGSVNAGIISARGRDIQSGPYDDYLQIDAQINRGNSGGPLFDSRGRVIGVNTAIFSPSGGNIGIGFAIPAETAEGIVNQLIAKGRVDRGWLGVQIQPVTEEVAESLGLEQAGGVLVANVMPETPALRAGVKSGDIILKAAGQRLADHRELTKLIAQIEAGTEIELEVLRDGKLRVIDVVIGEMPGPELAQLGGGATKDANDPRIGLYLAPLTPETREERGLATDAEGVLVAEVAPGSPSQRAGIEPGSLISMVGQRTVNTPEELVDAVRAAAKNERPSVLLRVEKDGEQRFITVPFG